MNTDNPNKKPALYSRRQFVQRAALFTSTAAIIATAKIASATDSYYPQPPLKN